MTYQIELYLEEDRELTRLTLLSVNDQDPFWASPTVEAQMAWQVMEDIINHGSDCLASFVVRDTFQHSGGSKLKVRLRGEQS